MKSEMKLNSQHLFELAYTLNKCIFFFFFKVNTAVFELNNITTVNTVQQEFVFLHEMCEKIKILH